jgi:hypothetical protein
MQRCPSVPPLFRQMPINTTKRHEPTHSEIPAQRHERRSGDQSQKFELYFDQQDDAARNPVALLVRASHNGDHG